MILFSTINNILISVNSSNFTLVALKTSCYVNPDAEKNGRDQAHMFQDKYFKSC